MKKILIKTLLLLVVVTTTSCESPKPYCGLVVDKYLLHKNNGGNYNVVFYCKPLSKKITVSVTASCYVNCTISETTVCFDLYENQINK